MPYAVVAMLAEAERSLVDLGTLDLEIPARSDQVVVVQVREDKVASQVVRAVRAVMAP